MSWIATKEMACGTVRDADSISHSGNSSVVSRAGGLDYTQRHQRDGMWMEWTGLTISLVVSMTVTLPKYAVVYLTHTRPGAAGRVNGRVNGKGEWKGEWEGERATLSVLLLHRMTRGGKALSLSTKNRLYVLASCRARHHVRSLAPLLMTPCVPPRTTG